MSNYEFLNYILTRTASFLFTVAMLTTVSQADTNHSAGIMHPQGVRIVFNDSEFYFNASNGGEITEYYDLSVDPSRTRNLANINVPGRLQGNLVPLFASLVYNKYIELIYSTGGDPNASVNLVEKTNESIILYTTSRIMNRSGLIVTNTAGYPVYINTTWTFDNSTGLIFVERTFSTPTSYNLPAGWRWYPFYFTRSTGFIKNATFYFFNATYSKTVISNGSSYVNDYSLFPVFPIDNKSIFGVAMPFANTSIEGDGAHNVVITYYYDSLNVSEWKSDTSNILVFKITEAGAVHEFSEPINIITHTYRAVVNFTHQQINESNVVGYAKYADSLYPLVELNLTTDNEVYHPGDAYTISVSGTSQYNLTNLTLKLVATNNSGIYFENEYGSKNYTKGETFSTVLFRGNISNESSGNLTFTAELVSQTGAIKASDSKTVIVTQPPQSDRVISGCTVINRPGTYVINQSITNSLVNYCINITSSNVVLDGAGYTINGVNAMSAAYGIYVYNSTTHLTNVTVKNLTVMNWGNGIYYKNAANGRIEKNTLSSTNTGGIILASSNNNILSGNTANSNSQYGIDISYSNNNNISGNTASSNSIGIILFSSSNNVLNGNTADMNSQYGIDLSSNSNNNILSSNAFTSNSIGIIQDSSNNNTLSGNTANSNNQYGIDISYSNNNNISGNTVLSNSIGIILYSSSNNVLNGNNASNNMLNGNKNYGFDLSYSNNNTLSGNTASSNSIGILLYSSSNNMLNGNTASSNSQYGIDLSSSSNNNIIYNNFFNNSNNFVISNSISNWNITKMQGMNIIGGSYLGGNIWATPNGTGFSQTCADSNSDGICDSSYTLDSNNIDYLPLAYKLIKGDVNGDGAVTITDALFIAQYSAGLRTLTSTQLEAADVNCDGAVTITDALFIAQYTAGLRTTFC